MYLFREPFRLFANQFGSGHKLLQAAWATKSSPLLEQCAYKPERSPLEYGHEVFREAMKIPPSRTCKVPRQMLHMNIEARRGIDESLSFLDDFLKELQHYHGAGGVTSSLSSMFTHFRSAFTVKSWSMQHQVGDADAFASLWADLHAHLRFTLWPGDTWPDVTLDRTWPRKAPIHEYKRLQRNVLEMLADDNLALRHFKGFRCYGLAPAVPTWSNIWVTLPLCVYLRIGSFNQDGVFTTKALKQASCGVPGLYVCRVHDKNVLVGKLAEEFEVDEDAVATAVEFDPRFSMGCWRAARLWHRARRIGSSTAVVESWSSVVDSFWDPTQGLSSGGVIARAMLRIAGYLGDGTDECVLDMVGGQLNASPLVGPRTMRRSAHKGKSHREIAHSKLVPMMDALKTRNAALLCSDEAQSIVTERKVHFDEAKTFSDWAPLQKTRAKYFDVGAPESADLDLFGRCSLSVDSKP